MSPKNLEKRLEELKIELLAESIDWSSGLFQRYAKLSRVILYQEVWELRTLEIYNYIKRKKGKKQMCYSSFFPDFSKIFTRFCFYLKLE